MTNTDNHDVDTKSGPFRRYAITTAKILAAVLLLAVFVHVSWNMFAPDMFGFEAIRMKQALGLIVFAGTFAVLFRFGHYGKHSATSQ